MDLGSTQQTLIHSTPGFLKTATVSVPHQLTQTTAEPFQFRAIMSVDLIPAFGNSVQCSTLRAHIFTAPCRVILKMGRDFLIPNNLVNQFSTQMEMEQYLSKKSIESIVKNLSNPSCPCATSCRRNSANDATIYIERGFHALVFYIEKRLYALSFYGKFQRTTMPRYKCNWNLASNTRICNPFNSSTIRGQWFMRRSCARKTYPNVPLYIHYRSKEEQSHTFKGNKCSFKMYPTSIPRDHDNMAPEETTRHCETTRIGTFTKLNPHVLLHIQIGHRILMLRVSHGIYNSPDIAHKTVQHILFDTHYNEIELQRNWNTIPRIHLATAQMRSGSATGSLLIASNLEQKSKPFCVYSTQHHSLSRSKHAHLLLFLDGQTLCRIRGLDGSYRSTIRMPPTPHLER